MTAAATYPYSRNIGTVGEQPPRLPQLEDLPDVAGKRVLVRCDFNVAVRRGRVIDDLRIRASTPTLEWLLRRGARVKVCTHLGRPAGRRDPRLSLDPVRAVLHQLVPGAELMENLRFHPGEEANDPRFVDYLVEGQDLFVNDAFATAHRIHASVLGPPTRLPSAAGRLMSRDVAVLSALRDRPRRPFVAVIGGEPELDLIGGITGLVEFVDTVVLGGGVAFEAMDALASEESRAGAGEATAPPVPRGLSGLVEAGRVVLPLDVVTVSVSGPADPEVGGRIPPGRRPVDIGHRSVARFAGIIERAGTVFWDGGMACPGGGSYLRGTQAVARAVAASSAFTVASGNETIAALDALGLSAFVDHVSTGAAASLAYLRDGDLPGVRAIRGAAAGPVAGG